MAGSFKTPCPSCEADVLVKGANLVGKKIDCPKCKYRFTVPAPDDDFEVVETKSKGNPKALVGIVLGVIGVAVLGIGAALMLGGGDESPKPAPGPSRTIAQTPPVDPQPGEPAAVEQPDEPATETPVGPQVPVDPTKFEKPKEPKKAATRVPPQMVPPGKLKDAANLLPGQSEAVMRITMDRLRQTPVYSAFFDRTMLDFFSTSMTFQASDIENVHFCLVDADRDPFVIIRTKVPMEYEEMIAKLDMKEAPFSPVNQRTFFKLESNAFMTALGRAFATEALMNDAGVPVTEDDKKRWQEKPMGLHLYDSQTLIVADLNILARFLSELDQNDDPPFQTKFVGDPDVPAGGDPAAPVDPSQPAPGKEGEIQLPPDLAQPNPADAPKLFTSLPNYLTIRPEMKQMLNRFEGDPKNPPAVMFAYRVDMRLFERETSAGDMAAILLQQFFPTIKIMGASISQFNKDKLVGTIAFHHLSESDVKESIEKRMIPMLKQPLLPILADIFGTNINLWEVQGNVTGPGSIDPSAGGAGGAGGGGGGQTFAPQGPGRGIGGNPGDAGAPGTDPNNQNPEYALNSKVTVSQSDLLAVVEVDLNINQEHFNKIVQPFVVSVATQMKGRMAVLSGDITWHSLSTKFIRLGTEKKQFPQGTLPRDSKPDRFGLPYPPDHRASFIVDLLPYLNQGRIRSTIQEKKYAWYESQNMKAATSWIPELLVPYYPQTAWRAHHPLAPGATLGATNFVALSGIGRDSARYNPSDAELSKLVGITGYEWGSKPAEIKDGLSNTIYMIQVPPGHNRPWIAGGGATVMGVADDDKPLADFVSADPEGKRGTHALMADGSVRFIPENVDPALFKALVTRAGGESIDDLDKKLPATKPPKKFEAEIRGGGSTAGAGKKDDRAAINDAELQKIQGKWKVGYMFRGGKAVPSSELDALDMVITIEDVQMTIEAGGNAQGVVIRMLDPKAKPAAIDFQNDDEAAAGTMTVGIYELDGNKLRLRYVKNASAERRPTVLSVPGAGTPPDESYIEMNRMDTKEP